MTEKSNISLLASQRAQLETRENNYACCLETLATAADQVAKAAADAQKQNREAALELHDSLSDLPQSQIADHS
jgi:hypothetical protein